MEIQNCYEVLGLRKGASEAEIKKSYVELVKKFDPEKHTERFMVIQKSYESVRDPAKRAVADCLVYSHTAGRFLFTAEEQTTETDDEVSQRVDDARLQNDLTPDAPTRTIYIKALMAASYKKVGKRLWNDAIADWEQVLEVDPTHQRAKNNLLYSHITLGYNYATHELHEEAVAQWEQALRMNPDDENLIHNLAIACGKAGKITEAERYWNAVLQRWQAKLANDPDDVYIKNLIVEARRFRGEQASGEQGETSTTSGPQSIDEYREILKINPDDFEAQYKIATLLMEEQVWDEAAKMLIALLRQYPKNIEVMNLLGWAKINSGQIEEAFRIWNRSLALDKNNHSTREAIIKGRMSMGRAFRNKGMHTQSLVHFKALLRLTPNSSEVNMEIGETYLGMGDKRSASIAFRKVIALDPKNREARQHLSNMKLRG